MAFNNRFYWWVADSFRLHRRVDDRLEGLVLPCYASAIAWWISEGPALDPRFGLHSSAGLCKTFDFWFCRSNRKGSSCFQSFCRSANFIESLANRQNSATKGSCSYHQMMTAFGTFSSWGSLKRWSCRRARGRAVLWIAWRRVGHRYHPAIQVDCTSGGWSYKCYSLGEFPFLQKRIRLSGFYPSRLSRRWLTTATSVTRKMCPLSTVPPGLLKFHPPILASTNWRRSMKAFVGWIAAVRSAILWLSCRLQTLLHRSAHCYGEASVK